MTCIPRMGGLPDVVAKPVGVIFEKLWLSGKIPSDWKKGNITPISKKGRKEHLGSYGLVGLVLASPLFSVCSILASPFYILLCMSPFGFCLPFLSTLFTEAAGTPGSILVYGELIFPSWSQLVPNVTGKGQSLTTTYTLLRLLTRFIGAKFNLFHPVKPSIVY